MFGFIRRWELKDSLVLMRIFIGWHFLYEGIVKFYNPDWTAFGYLASAKGPLKPLFVALTDESLIGTVDTLNMVALVVIGLTLILGVFEKLGTFLGILLLAFYYLAHPPFPWLEQVNVEGNYWFVNKNLIELAALMVLFKFPTGSHFGLRALFKQNF